MSKYKVSWGWFDGEENQEEYDDYDEAYESFLECQDGYEHPEWAILYRIDKSGCIHRIKRYSVLPSYFL